MKLIEELQAKTLFWIGAALGTAPSALFWMAQHPVFAKGNRISALVSTGFFALAISHVAAATLEECQESQREFSNAVKYDERP